MSRVSVTPGDAEAGQELERERQRDPGDRDAQDEEDDGERHPRQGQPSFLGREPGRHELPQLVDDDRQPQQDADHDGDLAVVQEGAAHGQELELGATAGLDRRGLREHGDDLGRQHPADGRADDDRHDADEQPVAQLRQVVDEAHHALVRGRCRGRDRGHRVGALAGRLVAWDPLDGAGHRLKGVIHGRQRASMRATPWSRRRSG